MDDIEDLIKDDGEVLVPRNRNAVMPRVRRRKGTQTAKEVCKNIVFMKDSS